MGPRSAPRALRASDADRDRVVAMLAAAVADGRLTPDEHCQRTEAALTARTLRELARLTSDLALPAQQPIRLDVIEVSWPRPRTSRRRAGRTAPSIEIEQAARILRLPAVREVYQEAAARALRERSTYKEYLADVLGAEVARRRQRLVRATRARRAAPAWLTAARSRTRG